MNTIVLAGCTPEPLGNYLKALGVFRLVAEQADPTMRAWWKDGVFHIATCVADIVGWFRHSYRPSPVPTPWSVNSGWWPPRSQPPTKGDKRNSPYQALRMLCASDHPRYEAFRSCLRSYLRAFMTEPPLPDEEAALPDGLRAILKSLEQANKKRIVRSSLQRSLRNYLDEPASLQWLDAIGALTRRKEEEDVLAVFPLLADAGAEGVNSFAGNFYQRLAEHLPFWEPHQEFWETDQGHLSERRLRSALFGEPVQHAREADAAGGLYFPGLVEAPNVGQRFIADPKKRTNPWDFILAMEGMLLWAAAVTRRTLVAPQDRPSFPFFCESALGGNACLGPSEAPGHADAKSRGELWCPLWDRPAALIELSRLFAEGRVTVADRTAERASEFAMGVASLGTERGISSFVRTGLLERSGSGDQRTTLAISLGNWAPRQSPTAHIVAELLDFANAVTRLLQHHDNQPRRLVLARERFERAIFDAVGKVQQNHGDQLTTAIVAAAALEREIGVTCGKVKYKRGKQLAPREIIPIQPLTVRWIDAADQSTAEFRLAHAVASIASWRGSDRVGEATVASLRYNLLPLRRDGDRWVWDDRSRSAVWSRGAGLFENMAAVLRRRLIDASRVTGEGPPLWSSAGATFEDLLGLWNGGIDPERVDDLIHALALVDVGSHQPQSAAREAEGDDATGGIGNYRAELAAASELPRAYTLLKLCFLGGRLPARPTSDGAARRTGDEPFPPRAPEILNLLLAGRAADALVVAARKLRAKGYPPLASYEVFRTKEFALTAHESRRLAGLLLIPVRRPNLLARMALKPKCKT